MRTVADILLEQNEQRMRAAASLPGVPRGRGRPRKVTDAVFAVMKELRAQGLSQGAIARRVGISRTSAGTWLHGTGRAAKRGAR